MRALSGLLIVGCLCFAPAAAQAYVTVSSNEILALGDPGGPGDAGFWATILTPPYPGGQNILYGPDALTDTGSSRVVFDLNGAPLDMTASEPVAIPVTTAGSGLGASITMAKTFGSLEYGTTYTIVVDPHAGVGADSVQVQAWVADHAPAGSGPASVGVRILLDTMVGENDGSPLSIDNGVSVIGANTLDQAVTDGVPSDWWSYNQYPSTTLTAQGVVWGNQFGTPATQPDAVEFCQWPDVGSPGYWGTDPFPGALFSTYDLTYSSDGDTCVVLWYTNTGQAGSMDGDTAEGDGYSVAPGTTLVFTTYCGLSESPFGATPTPYLSFTDTPTVTASPTITPTFSVSPSFSVSPTTSPTFSVSPTWSVSPTYTVSPTKSPSFTASPTFSASPTDTASPTDSPSYTASPSFSASPTATPTPSITPSFSVSPTPSVTPTFSVSPTFSASPTVTPTLSVSPTFSVSPTPSASGTARPSPSATPQQLSLNPKYANPDPSQGPIYLPYVLTCDAEVNIRIYDVAGETVRDLAPFAGLSGANEEYWDGRNSSGAQVASGVFIAHITASALGETADAWVKMAILR